MSRTIYTYFDATENAPADQAVLLRLFVQSWSARGWTPRILTIRNAQRNKRWAKLGHNPRVHQVLAQDSVGALPRPRGTKLFSDLRTINFSYTPRSKEAATVWPSAHAAARTAALVYCPSLKHFEALGRPL